MTEQGALLQAIRQSPADDSVRLVYADWLEEHGQPERAELIRVRCPDDRTSRPRRTRRRGATAAAFTAG